MTTVQNAPPPGRGGRPCPAGLLHDAIARLERAITVRTAAEEYGRSRVLDALRRTTAGSEDGAQPASGLTAQPGRLRGIGDRLFRGGIRGGTPATSVKRGSHDGA